MVIYGLRHPVTKELRYVGKANDANKRLLTHIRDAARRHTPVVCWIASLIKAGARPDVVTLKETSSETWKDDEREAIAYHRRHGARLLNIADGGDEPKQTLEQRQGAGMAAAKSRDKRWHMARLRMGMCLRELAKHGMAAKEKEMREKIRAFALAVIARNPNNNRAKSLLSI